jgi:hypothetical protein
LKSYQLLEFLTGAEILAAELEHQAKKYRVIVAIICGANALSQYMKSSFQ